MAGLKFRSSTPHTGSEFVAAGSSATSLRADNCWRSEDRRYEGNVKFHGKRARLKAAATNSTPTSAPAALPFSNFLFPFSALNLSEVKNEKLQH
jgi:hypothetical protein